MPKIKYTDGYDAYVSYIKDLNFDIVVNSIDITELASRSGIELKTLGRILLFKYVPRADLLFQIEASLKDMLELD